MPSCKRCAGLYQPSQKKKKCKRKARCEWHTPLIPGKGRQISGLSRPNPLKSPQNRIKLSSARWQGAKWHARSCASFTLYNTHVDPGVENSTSLYSHVEKKIGVRAIKHGIYDLETIVKRPEYAETETEMWVLRKWSYWHNCYWNFSNEFSSGNLPSTCVVNS